jgi:uncharacterized protein YkwD
MRLTASLAMMFVIIAGAHLTSAQEVKPVATQEAKPETKPQEAAKETKPESKVVPASATTTVTVKAAPAKVLSPTEATAVDFLRYVNYARSLNGAGPLVVDPYLMSVAASHTHWMASSGRFQHSSYGVAENIAMGQRSVWEVYNSWWNSSGHRQNLLGRGYSRVGLAYVNGYWTAVFQ